MDIQEAQRELEQLREEIRYHSRKYYTEDDPEISDREYDMLYRRLEDLEARFPQLVTPDSPTQKVGGAVYNTFARWCTRCPWRASTTPSPRRSSGTSTAGCGKPWAAWSMWSSPSSTASLWPWNT